MKSKSEKETEQEINREMLQMAVNHLDQLEATGLVVIGVTATGRPVTITHLTQAKLAVLLAGLLDQIRRGIAETEVIG